MHQNIPNAPAGPTAVYIHLNSSAQPIETKEEFDFLNEIKDLHDEPTSSDNLLKTLYYKEVNSIKHLHGEVIVYAN